MPFLGVIFGAISSIFTGFFGMKDKQQDTIQAGIAAISAEGASQSQSQAAAASVIVAEATSSSRLAADWRPLLMYLFIGIILSYWLGYTPKALMQPTMPPMISEIFDLIKIGMGGYIGGRSMEKVVDSVVKSGVISKYIAKEMK